MASVKKLYYNYSTNSVYDEMVGPVLTTDTFIEINRDDYYSYISDGKGVTFDPGTSGITTFERTFPSFAPSNEEIITDFYFLIQNQLLNSVPLSYGYSSIENAISYYNSGITAWRNEAIAFNTWRDNTETLMYDNIFSFTADGITLPDLGGFTSQTGYFDVGITASRPNLFS